MNASQIKALLTEMGIAHFEDSGNPTFTIHVGDSDSLIDAMDEEGPWEFLSHRHSATKSEYFRDIKTIDELRDIMSRFVD